MKSIMIIVVKVIILTSFVLFSPSYSMNSPSLSPSKFFTCAPIFLSTFLFAIFLPFHGDNAFFNSLRRV